MRYKTTSKGTQLPDRWGLPDALRDDTGVIFASVFPGYRLVRRRNGALLRRPRPPRATGHAGRPARTRGRPNGQPVLRQEIDRRIAELQEAIAKEPYPVRPALPVPRVVHGALAVRRVDRRARPQHADQCGVRQHDPGVALAEDWIRAGRCRRVIVISADDITSDHLIEWFGAGFLASGAAATDDVVEEAAIPFDRRRHGMIMGMGAAALVVESAEAADERGLRPICEVLSAVTANSAFHGTRLDVEHIRKVMEKLVRQAETRSGIRREQVAPSMVFVSHETYTPGARRQRVGGDPRAARRSSATPPTAS